MKKIILLLITTLCFSCLTTETTSENKTESKTSIKEEAVSSSLYMPGQGLEIAKNYEGFGQNVFPTRAFESKVSTDGKYLVAHTELTGLIAYDTSNMKPVWNKLINEDVKIKITPDNKQVTCLVRGKGIYFWDIESGNLDFVIKNNHTKYRDFQSYDFAKNGTQIIASSYGMIYQFDLVTKELIKIMTIDDAKNVYYLTVNDFTNEFILRNGSEDKFRVYDIETGLNSRNIDLRFSPSAVNLSGNGQYLAVGSYSGELEIIDFVTGNVSLSETIKGNGFMNIKLSNNGELLAYCNSGLTIRNWIEGKEVYKDKEYSYAVNFVEGDSKVFYDIPTNFVSYDFNERKILIKHPKEWLKIYDVEPILDDKVLTATPYKHNSPNIVWDLDQMEHFTSFGDYDTSAYEMKVLPDNKSVIVLTDYNLYREDFTTNKQLWFNKNKVRYYDLEMDNKGKHLILGGYENGIIDIYDAVTGEIKKRIEIESKRMRINVSVSQENDILAYGAIGDKRNTVIIASAITGETIRAIVLDNYSDATIKVSDDGKTLFTAESDGTVTVWSIESGEKLSEYETGNKRPRNIDYNGSNNSIAISYFNTTATLITLDNGVVTNLLGHTYQLTDVTFSNNGKYLYTSSWDSSFRIWDSNSGDFILAVHIVDDKNYIIHNDEYVYATDDAIKYLIHYGRDEVLIGDEVYTKFGNKDFYKNIIN
ncbi:MAG: WD40 repeat domain-containing protein [Spirochaetaceae bacterium]